MSRWSALEVTRVLRPFFSFSLSVFKLTVSFSSATAVRFKLQPGPILACITQSVYIGGSLCNVKSEHVYRYFVKHYHSASEINVLRRVYTRATCCRATGCLLPATCCSGVNAALDTKNVISFRGLRPWPPYRLALPRSPCMCIFKFFLE